MGSWKGPFGRDHVIALVSLWVISLIGACFTAVLIVREDGGLFLITYILASALILGLAVMATRRRHEIVWSSEYSRYRKDPVSILKTLGDVMGVKPEIVDPPFQHVLRVGESTVVIRKSLGMTTVFVGPKDATETEKLKRLVDRTLG